MELLSFSILSVRLFSADPDPAKIDSFLRQLNDACSKADPAAIKPLCDWTEASPADIDESLDMWQTQFDFAKKEKQSAQPAVFLALGSKEVSDETVSPVVMNGHTYQYNLPLIGFAKVSFSDGKTSASAWNEALGIASNGEIRMICLIARSETPNAAPDSVKISDFVHRVDSLCTIKDTVGLKYLYDWDGASSEVIDTEVMTWEYPFAHQAYKKTEFLALTDATGSKFYNPDAIKRMVEGYVGNGKIFKPNLPVFGFVTCTFKDTHQNPEGVLAGTMRPVGMAQDGTIRFVSMVVTDPKMNTVNSQQAK